MKNKKISCLNHYIQIILSFLFNAIFLSFISSSSHAAVNVADFLEWATPLQIAKVEKTFGQVIGEEVNWGFYSSGAKMSEAMVAGEVDIAFSQGMAPFVSAVNANAKIKIVVIAVAYDAADDCVIRNALNITKDNPWCI